MTLAGCTYSILRAALFEAVVVTNTGHNLHKSKLNIHQSSPFELFGFCTVGLEGGI